MSDDAIAGEHEDCIRTEPHWPAQCVAPYPQGLHDPEYCDLDNVHLVPSRCHAPQPAAWARRQKEEQASEK